MAKNISIKHIGTATKGLFVAHTNAGIWVRILISVVLVNILGITLSLLFFFSARNSGNTPVQSTLSIPKTDNLDRVHVHDVVNAFAQRVAQFDALEASPISLPDLYTGGK